MKALPKKIRLLNQEISIVFDNDYCNNKDVLGESDINHNEIKICSKFDGGNIPIERQYHTLFHELTHFMLFMTGHQDMYKDEILTDNLGTALYDLVLNNFGLGH